MRDLTDLDAWRSRDKAIIEHYGWAGDGTCGVFMLPLGGQTFVCVASSEGGWDHVSISLQKRCPTWKEMDYLKRRFFTDDEVAIQFHVKPSQHISLHPWTLHLWRPQFMEMPLPPAVFV